MVDTLSNVTLQIRLTREARAAEAAAEAKYRNQAQTTTSQAIKLFLAEYSDMEEDRITRALFMFENKTRADVFLQLDQGTIRNNWLNAAIEKG